VEKGRGQPEELQRKKGEKGGLTNPLNLGRSMSCSKERRKSRRYTSEQPGLPWNRDCRVPDLEAGREGRSSNVGGGVEANAKRVDVLDEVAVGTERDATGRGAGGA